MSQPPYPQRTPSASYPYGAYTSSPTAYPAGHYAGPGYSAAPGGYPAGTPGYGTAPWPYYGYFPPQPGMQVPGQMTRPATQPNSTVSSPYTPSLTIGPPVTSTARTLYNPSPYTRESSAAPASGSGTRGARKQNNFKGLFAKELRNLMYGFGDDRSPASDTVNVMEEILVEYITDVCQTALGGRKTRLSIEDLRRALSRPADAKKLARMEELLFMQEDIKRARAQFEDNEMKDNSAF